MVPTVYLAILCLFAVGLLVPRPRMCAKFMCVRSTSGTIKVTGETSVKQYIVYVVIGIVLCIHIRRPCIEQPVVLALTG